MTLGDVIFGCFTVFMLCVTVIVIFAPREDSNNKKNK